MVSSTPYSSEFLKYKIPSKQKCFVCSTRTNTAPCIVLFRLYYFLCLSDEELNQNMNQNLFPMTDDRVNLNDSKFIREMYHRNEQRMNLFDPLNSRNDMLYNNGMANMPRDYINYNNNNKDYMDSNPRSRNYMSHDTHMTAERNRKKSENERIDNNMMESIEIIELGQYKRYRKLLAYLISLFVKGQARANSLDLNDEDLQILKIIIYRKFKKHVDIK